MKNTKITFKNTLLTGSIIAGALTGLTSNVNASNLFNYSSLGSGAEIRAELLDESLSTKLAELECGEKAKTGESKCGESKSAEAKCGEGKSAEAKCGEGKCGEDKKDGKAKEAKATDSKSKTGESKCGEAKCGEKKK